MKSFDSTRPLKTLPLHTAPPRGQLSPVERALEDLQQRGQFLRAYSPNDPNAPQLDPVLRFHLGLDRK